MTEKVKDILEVPIIELLSKNECTVRLSNAINRAIANESWKYETLGSYIEAGDEGYAELLKVKHLGKNSVNEFVALVNDVLNKPENHFEKVPSEIDQEILDITFTQLLTEFKCSIRLVNALSGEIEGDDWPYETLGDYLAAGHKAYQDLLKVPNLGRTSAEEFVTLITSLCDGSVSPTYCRQTTSGDICENGNGAERANLDMTFEHLLWGFKCSERLVNALSGAIKRGEWTYITLGDYLSAGQKAFEDLMRVPNLGRASAQELVALIGTLCSEPARIIPSAPEGNYITSPKLDELSPRQQLEVLLSGLTERAREVLVDRLGLDGRPKKTLETIGALQNVTRERIRQIESKALKSIAHPSNRLILEILQKKAISDFWSRTRKIVLSDKQARRIFNHFEDHYKVVIAAVYGSEDKWFKEAFESSHSHIINPKYSKYELNRLSRSLRAEFENHRMPVRKSTLALTANVDTRVLDGALALITDVRRFGDLIFEGGGSKRPRRAGRLLGLLDECSSSFGEHTLDTWDTYRKQHEDDPCSPRDLEIIYFSHPHLFISTGFHVWSTQRRCRDNTYDANEASVMHAPPLASTSDLFQRRIATYMNKATGIRKEVYSVLSNDGPQTVSSIIKREISTKGGTTGLLGQEPTILKMAPGVFGLPAHLNPTDERLSYYQALFGEDQCKYYAMNRYAGEPVNSYPLWSWAYEKQLAYWARDHHAENVYRSLLRIIEPTHWPISSLEISDWEALRMSQGEYTLTKVPDYRLEFVPFDLKALYILFKFSTARTSLSWVSINRCHGHRVDSRFGIWPLMIMICLGMLSPAETWQLAHPVCGTLSEWMESCSLSLEKSGHLSWDSDEGVSLLRLVRQGTYRLENTWADAGKLESLLTLIEVPAVLDDGTDSLRAASEMSDYELTESFEEEALDLLGLYS